MRTMMPKGCASAKVLLTWPKVAERIRTLIETNRFLTPETEAAYITWKAEKEQQKLVEAREKLVADAEKKHSGEIAVLQEPEQEETDNRVVVALESTEDVTDYSIGFFTYHYQDGREGVRYRLVTIGEDGRLEAYPEKTKFFINETAARDYIASHTEELQVIPYDELVHQAGREILQNISKQWEKPEPEQTEAENQDTKSDEPDFLQPDLIPEPEPQGEKEKIDTVGARNFRITDDVLGAGTAKQKFERNVAAIQTLQRMEQEHRTATLEEQTILSQYVGWGGLAEAFDETNRAWNREYAQLKSLLSPEEYVSARESTLNAHYTSPVIIRSIYEALGRMGFEKGNILEPSMGTGNFFGMLPEGSVLPG